MDKYFDLISECKEVSKEKMDEKASAGPKVVKTGELKEQEVTESRVPVKELNPEKQYQNLVDECRKAAKKEVDEGKVSEQKEIVQTKDVRGQVIKKGDKVRFDEGEGSITAVWDDGCVDIEYTTGPGGPLSDTFDIKGHDVEKIEVEESKVTEQEEESGLEEPPAPPEEVKEPETKDMEMRKEYLGKSEDTHYYFITTEGAVGEAEDLLITDQEGVKKYSAKDHNMDVSEGGIADFIIKAIQDVKIEQIERPIFMKYILPKLEEEAPEEEIIGEPEEKEPKREKPKEKEPKEEPTKIPPEEEPVESRKVSEKFNLGDRVVITWSGDIDAPDSGIVHVEKGDRGKVLNVKEIKDKISGQPHSFYIVQLDNGKKILATSGEIKREAEEPPEEESLERKKTVDAKDGKVNEDRIENIPRIQLEDLLRDGEALIKTAYEAGLEIPGINGVKNIVAKVKTELDKRPKDKKTTEGKNPNQGDKEATQIKKLSEMKVTDPEGNTFDVHLVDDGTMDTVIDVSGREFRFDAEFASYWRDEEGALSEEGLKELALDALANIEEEEYAELVAKDKGEEEEEAGEVELEKPSEEDLDQLVAKRDELKAKEEAGTLTPDMKEELVDLEKRIKELGGIVESKTNEQGEKMKKITVTLDHIITKYSDDPADVEIGTKRVNVEGTEKTSDKEAVKMAIEKVGWDRISGFSKNEFDKFWEERERGDLAHSYFIGPPGEMIYAKVGITYESKTNEIKKGDIDMAEINKDKKQSTLESIKADIANWVNNVAEKKDLVDLWSKVPEVEVKSEQVEDNKADEAKAAEFSQMLSLLKKAMSPTDEMIRTKDALEVLQRFNRMDLEKQIRDIATSSKYGDRLEELEKLFVGIDEAKIEGEDAEAVAKKSAAHHAKQDKAHTAKPTQGKQLGDPKEDADKIAKQSATHHAKQDKPHAIKAGDLKQLKSTSESIEEKLFTKQFEDLAVGADFMHDGRRCVKYSETEYKSGDKVYKIAPKTEVEAIEKPRRENKEENVDEATEGTEIDVYTSAEDETPQKATMVSYARGEPSTIKLASGKTAKATFDDRSNKWIIREDIEEPEEDEEIDILNDDVQEAIEEMLDSDGVLDEAKKKKLVGKHGRPLKKGAAGRNRGRCVFPWEHSKVTDKKDHFPINTENQARNALARVNQYKEAPKWYKGSLESLVGAVVRAVKKAYPDIKVTKAAEKPGKGPKESKIPVEEEQMSISERKGLERLNELLGLNG
jgi:hypothetical protein